MSNNDIRKLKATLLLAASLLGLPKDNVYALDNENIYDIELIDKPIYGDRLIELLNSFSDGIKNYLISNNLKVVLIDNSFGADMMFKKLYGYSLISISGFTYDLPDSTTIYVEASKHPGFYEKNHDSSKSLTEDEFNYILAKDTLLHELGHFFDASMNFELSNSQEFNQIFNSEAKNYQKTTQYNVDNLKIYANISTPVEYFASAYSCYISYPDSLKENCPLTYNYIYNFMQLIEKEYAPNNNKHDTFTNNKSKVLKLN